MNNLELNPSVSTTAKPLHRERPTAAPILRTHPNKTRSNPQAIRPPAPPTEQLESELSATRTRAPSQSIRSQHTKASAQYHPAIVFSPPSTARRPELLVAKQSTQIRRSKKRIYYPSNSAPDAVKLAASPNPPDF